ncbi:MAG: hypothetical protein R6V85_16580 [Polyangia bacterium]
MSSSVDCRALLVSTLSAFLLAGCAASAPRSCPAYSDEADGYLRISIVARRTAAADDRLLREIGRAAFDEIRRRTRFIVVSHDRIADELDRSGVCNVAGRPLDAVLVLTPRHFSREGDRFRIALAAALVDCADGGHLWSQRAGDSYPAGSDSPWRGRSGAISKLTKELLGGLRGPGGLSSGEEAERLRTHARQLR